MKEYEIGYKKPPKDTKFKPGVSGNPNGRPKGSKNFRTLMLEKANAKISVIENGVRKEITRQEALVTQMWNLATAGDHKARSQVMDFLNKNDVTEERIDDAIEAVNESDHKILDRLLKRYGGEYVSQ
jgi:hypothetical protein